MPEDYQAVLSDLGVDVNADNTGDEPAQDTVTDTPATDTTATNTPADNANAETNNTVEPQQPEVNQAEEQARARSNEAFAAMRSENTKYKKFISQLMKGANYQGSEDDYIEQMTNAAYSMQAKNQGGQVSPEILKRMDALESQNQAYLDERNRNTFMANVKNLQDTYKLSDNDIKEFLNLAVTEKIDLTQPGTNFLTLYRGLFFDKLQTKLVEEERQKWIEQNSKSNNAANPDGKSGKKDPTPTDVNTMAEFDSLLKSIPNNVK